MEFAANWTKEHNKLGSGGSASVYLAKSENPSLPSVMAVKSVMTSEVSKYRRLLTEGNVLSSLQGSPYIIRCYGTDTTIEKGTDDGSDFEYFNVLLEYTLHGSLKNCLDSDDLPEEEVKLYTRCLLQGLQHIHENGYVHCDIKPQNILLFHSSELKCTIPKIADFGHAQRVGESLKKSTPRLIGTLRYMAPESLNMNEYEPPCDIWALGCTVLQMLTKNIPWFLLFTEENVKARIACSQDIPEIPKTLSFQAQDFLKKCLARDQSDRWTIEALLAHPFLFNEDAGRSCRAGLKRGRRVDTTPPQTQGIN
ncbi:hypothetical protein ACHQM5_008007 [Ranunculus cassubicifolius]